MNATLEAMAQALFKSWFVDFDPVIDNALAAGNPIPDELEAKAAARQALGDARKPLPEDIRSLFPNAFVFTEEMGWIPEGWKIKEIKELGRVITGKTPSKDVTNAYSDCGIPFITPTDIDDSLFVSSTNRYLSEYGQLAVRNTKITAGSICVTCIGSQMGKTVIAPKDSFTNQQINTVIVKNKTWRNYLFLTLRGRKEEIFLMGSAGSTMPIINKSTFEKLLLIFPDDKLLMRFHESMDSMLFAVLRNDQQNKNLSEIRDALLPKLLSGELRIPEADQLIKETLA
jgi:type I restriction enzyme S subunit